MDRRRVYIHDLKVHRCRARRTPAFARAPVAPVFPRGARHASPCPTRGARSGAPAAPAARQFLLPCSAMLPRILIADRGAGTGGAAMHAAALLAGDRRRHTGRAAPCLRPAALAVAHRPRVAPMIARHSPDQPCHIIDEVGEPLLQSQHRAPTSRRINRFPYGGSVHTPQPGHERHFAVQGVELAEN